MKCSKCLNNETVRKIDFDDCGVCNYCRKFMDIQNKLEDRKMLERLFVERIEKIKGKYKYDVVLGISGGKDSIYVLHQLTQKYGLKVKTFTLNNGFLSDLAIKNIDNLVKDFGVEHEYIEFDEKLLKKLYHFSMKKYLVPCVACAFIGYAAMINYAMRNDAGMCVHGRSPEQMLRGYGNDVFTSFIDLGLKSINDVKLDEEYNNILNEITDNLDSDIGEILKEMLFSGVSDRKFREFVPYFLYHEYDEQKIVKFLKQNTSWRPPCEYDHYDCTIHNAAKYIYQEVEGRPHCLPELSVLVRGNKISKKDGEEILKNKVISKKPKEELDALCKYAEVNKNTTLLKAKLYRSCKKI